jgi:hypothetical protein
MGINLKAWIIYYVQGLKNYAAVETVRSQFEPPTHKPEININFTFKIIQRNIGLASDST